MIFSSILRHALLRCATLRVLLAGLVCLALSTPVRAAPGDYSFQETKITNAELSGAPLGLNDWFGWEVESADVNGDEILDLLVSAPLNQGGDSRGAIYVLFLAADGSLTSQAVIDDTSLSGATDVEAGMAIANPISIGSRFGSGLAWLGDYDGDGMGELAVGEPVVNTSTGRVWIIDVTTAGIPDSYFVLDSTDFPGQSLSSGYLGEGLANLGDWDQDGAPELAIGAPWLTDVNSRSGGVFLAYLDPSASATGIRGFARLSQSVGNLGISLAAVEYFGTSVTAIDDLNNDGQIDLAIGAEAAGNPNLSGGAYIVLLDPACSSGGSSPWSGCAALPGTTVTIKEGQGGFGGSLVLGRDFGSAVTWLRGGTSQLGDRLIVGHRRVPGYALPATTSNGGFWIIHLNSDGTVASEVLVRRNQNSAEEIAFSGSLGSGLAPIGDLNGDGSPDLAVGAAYNDTDDTNSGAVYLARMNPCPIVITNTIVYPSLQDDGVNSCIPAALGSGGTIHIYASSGLNATVNPAEVCADGLGEGDEVCAVEIGIEALNGFTLSSFRPASIAPSANPSVPNLTGMRFTDVLPGSTTMRVAWVGTPSTAPLGAVKIGDLTLSWNGDEQATVDISVPSYGISSALRLEPIAASRLAIPEPGVEGALLFGIAGLLGMARRRSSGPVYKAQWARVGLSLLVVFGIFGNPRVSRGADSIESFSDVGNTFTNLFPNPQALYGASVRGLADFDGDGSAADLVVGLPNQNPSSTVIGVVASDQEGVELTIAFSSSGEISTSDIGAYYGMSSDVLSEYSAASCVGGTNCPTLLAVGSTGSGVGDKDTVTLARLDEFGRVDARYVLEGNVAGVPGNARIGRFGQAVAELGDLDGDGTIEIAIGQPNSGFYSGVGGGAVWILSLAPLPPNAGDWPTTQVVVAATELSQNSHPGLLFGGAGEFGAAITAIGDLDGNGVTDLAVGMPNDVDTVLRGGAVWILFMQETAGVPSIASVQKISGMQGGFSTSNAYATLPLDVDAGFGHSLAWQPIPDGEGRGVLYVGSHITSDQVTSNLNPAIFRDTDSTVYALYLENDGTVISGYAINESSNVGLSDVGANYRGFGGSIDVLGDVNGDESIDLAVGAPGSYGGDGAVLMLFMKDSDHDGLDDNLDNCPGAPGLDPAVSHNPTQQDSDGDGVGDLCDVCPDVVDPLQEDFDGDRIGDRCEPVTYSLRPTGTPTSPSWDVLIDCGAWGLTEANFAVIPPDVDPLLTTAQESNLVLGCSSPPPGLVCATFDGVNSTVSGSGLVTPAGVRIDAYYLHLEGNGAAGQLCEIVDSGIPAGTEPAKVATLTTNAVTGTGVVAAALSEEGIETPGFGLSLAVDGAGPIPISEVEMVIGDPIPRLTLELGPAVVDGGNTRWDVLLFDTSERFVRVAFGLIAPFGTTTADMRFVGCDGVTVEPGEVRTCSALAIPRVGPTVNPANSWTVGPVVAAATPAGLREHTMYVVAEGGLSFFGGAPFLNHPGQPVVIGQVELTGSPDLEPALILEGVDLIDNRLGAGAIDPFDRWDVGQPSISDFDEVRLIGHFDPATDADGDGVQDFADNCTFIANAGQEDQGGFLSPDPDLSGNACQCGDGSGEGAVGVDSNGIANEDDFDAIFDVLAGRITAIDPEYAAIVSRCSVVGTTECNIRDLVFLRQAIDSSTPAEKRCDAALAPAP